MKIVIILLSVLAIGSIANAELPEKDGVAILKRKPNGDMLLGRVFLSESDAYETDTDNDTFGLPTCSGGKNIGIRAIRLHAPRIKPNGSKNLDALIKDVTIVFENGKAHMLQNINERLVVTNQSGDGLMIYFNQRRCVRSISVLGEQFEVGPNATNSAVDVVGIK